MRTLFGDWCNEQFFQRSKALCFGDNVASEKIMNESDPVKMHEFGKRIRGFDKEIWKNRVYRVLKRVNEVKFQTYPEAARFLVDTGDRRIGEGSPDPYFGIGCPHIVSCSYGPKKMEWNQFNGNYPGRDSWLFKINSPWLILT